jgi:hypothetical protein
MVEVYMLNISGWYRCVLFVAFSLFQFSFLGGSGSAAFAFAPVVEHSILNQTIDNGQAFNMSFYKGNVFSDADGDPLTVSVTQPSGLALPKWVTAKSVPFSSSPSIVGSGNPSTLYNAVAIRGNYAYLSCYTGGVKIMDVTTNVASPSLVSTIATTSARNVAFAGNLVYIADYSGGLKIFDITNPASPSSVGGIIGTISNAYDVTVVGNYAYVVDSVGLKVVDVTTPSSPNIVGSLNGIGSFDIEVVNDYAYLATEHEGFNIVDISNPASPVLVGTSTSLGYDTRGVDVVGNYAYVASGDGGLISGLGVIDISNPASPTLVGSLDTLNARDVKVIGNYAYVATVGENALKVIDVTNPASPVLIGSSSTTSSAILKSVGVAGHYAYTVDFSNGLIIADITKNISPRLIGSASTPGCCGYARGITIVGNYVYIGAGGSGLVVMNIENPESPSIAGSLDTVSNPWGVAVAGDYLYAAEFSSAGGLRTVDISNRASPTLLVSKFTSGYVRDVTIANGYAYLTEGSSPYYLRVFDITTDPANPSLVGSLSMSNEAEAVFVIGNYAYIANSYDGLRVVDVTTPSSPSSVGLLDTDGSAKDVVVVSDYAYVADWGSGLKIIDITTPSSPSLVGSLSLPGYSTAIAVAGEYAYVVDYSGNGSLHVVNIENPSSPILAGSFNLSDQGQSVIINGNYAYVGHDSGLDIVGDVEDRVILNGVPSIHDVGALDLSVTASDGADVVSTLFSIDVQNTPPVISNVTKIGVEDISLDFDATDFTNHYSDSEGNTLNKTKILSLPANGILKISGNNVNANQEIDAGELSSLAFVPNLNWYGNTEFGWQGYDGNAYSNTANVNIQINNVNDKPVISDVLKTGVQGNQLVFNATDFKNHFSDIEGNSLSDIRFVTLPANGVFRLSGGEVGVNQEIAAEEIGNLVFEPNANWHGNTTCHWQASDGEMYSDAANVKIQILDVPTPTPTPASGGIKIYPSLYLAGGALIALVF